MAEAARHGRREGLATFFVAGNSFPDGEESPPSPSGLIMVLAMMGRLLGPPSERKQSHTIRKWRSDFPGNAERHPFGLAYDHV